MKIKKDSFRKSRGGTSQLYKIFCASCDFELLTYQKDGKGSLIRLYVDRIISSNIPLSANLTCPQCSELNGTRIMYKPEQREAVRLVRGSIKKTKTGK